MFVDWSIHRIFDPFVFTIVLLFARNCYSTDVYVYLIIRQAWILSERKGKKGMFQLFP